MIKLIFSVILFVLIAFAIFFGVQSLYQTAKASKIESIKNIGLILGVVLLGLFLLFVFVSLF